MVEVLRGIEICMNGIKTEDIFQFLPCFLLPTDETEFRNFIVWLEDQKIRHYKIEDRGNLRNIHSEDWPKSFEKVFPCSKKRCCH